MEGHQRGTSARAAHDPRRPSLERPSLFAGSDDNLNESDGLRSVRILSTLESQERGKGPSLRGKGTRKTGATSAGHGASRANRSQGLLWALVVGGLACAGGALWWAQEGNAPGAPASPVAARTAVHQATTTAPGLAANTAAATSASAASAVAATQASASAVAKPSATPLAALIETSPPAAGPSVLKIMPSAATPETSASKAVVAAQATTSTAPEATATPAARPARERKAKAPKTSTAKASGQGDAPKRKDAHKPSSDRDVELLEAVMSHTERRSRH